MHAYFRNHQLYLAEKSQWLDRYVTKASKKALIEIESWKLIVKTDEQCEQIKMIEKVLQDTLLTPMPSKELLNKEGFYLYNLNN